jgi:CYTH domain-containing protein
MPKEIERKWRVFDYDSSMLGEGGKIVQGYLSIDPEVRVRFGEDEGFLTVKSDGDLERDQFDYPVPPQDALQMLGLCKWKVEKTRYRLGRFELDVYAKNLAGLVIIECELSSRDEAIGLPEGIRGREVTCDSRYKTKNLAQLGSLKELEG